jgi:hypothetical protein
MAGGFNPDEYNTVAERIEAFVAKYPEGSLQSEVIELSDKRVVMRGYAYRARDDERPGIGTSAMPIPATNAMLRNSEIETAETSAWGRAIAALGFEVRKAVATKNEVDAKKVDDVPSHADGLIGTVEVGKRPVDMEVRITEDEGMAWGFKLKNGRRSYQVLAHGDLADALSLVGKDLPGKRVEVWGSIDMIPWDKDGKPMPPYPRVRLERIKTDEWTLPAPDAIPVAEGQEALFDPAESARLDAEAVAAEA